MLAAGVDEARMQATVRELCTLGARMGGTDSGDAAAAYLAEAFHTAGLAVELRADPEHFCHQENSFRLVVHLPGPEGSASPGIELRHAWPWGFSPSSSGRVRLQLEAGASVAQLTERYRSPRSQRGAESEVAGPAVVLVDGANNLDGSWPQVHHLPARADNPIAVFGINAEEGRLLRGLLAAEVSVEIEFQIDATIRIAEPKTVIASIPAAAGSPPGFLLYCAHGDSDAGGPGADDNASGIAVVLEMARAWSAGLKAGTLAPPPRELRFAVWGSEIHSTGAYVRALESDAAPLLGVINYDQAGYGSGADQLNIEPDDLDANQSLIAALLECLDQLGGTPGFPTHWATNKSLGGTDSYAFSGNRRLKAEGRPALTLFTSAWDHPDEQPRTPGQLGESWSDRDEVSVDYDRYYHSAGDTPENTTDKEPWNMGWCARVGLIGGFLWLQRAGG